MDFMENIDIVGFFAVCVFFFVWWQIRLIIEMRNKKIAKSHKQTRYRPDYVKIDALERELFPEWFVKSGLRATDLPMHGIRSFSSCGQLPTRFG
jgi:hypothetical protein